jgi:hypothetical protein
MKIMLLLSVTAVLVLGQSSNRAVVRTTGQFEPDGNVIYSVYLASGQEDLEQITISAALPPGTRYLESVHKPVDGVYDGVKSDTVFWKIARLERDTVLGPLAFRVKLDGTVSELPATIQAAAAYDRPVPELVESPAPEGTLVPLAKSGAISFDQRGTLDASGKNGPVPVGETGIVIFIPEGAVTERVTLTFTRLNVAENKLPNTDPATWWCSLYQVTAEPRVTFSKSISAAFPSRRPLTPGIETSMFTTNDLESWQKTVGPSSVGTKTERSIGFGGGGFNQFGGQCISQFGFTTCGFGGGFGFGGFGGFGYVEQDNLKAKVTGSTIGTSAINAVTNPPSIIAILVGVRP